METELHVDYPYYGPVIQTVNHITIGQKYRVQIERAAVKGIDGFRVEVNGDDMTQVQAEIDRLYEYAKGLTYAAPVKAEEK